MNKVMRLLAKEMSKRNCKKLWCTGNGREDAINLQEYAGEPFFDIFSSEKTKDVTKDKLKFSI